MIKLISRSGLLAMLAAALVVLLFTAAFINGAVAEATDDPFFTDAEVQRILLHGPWPVEPPADAGNELSGIARAERVGELLFFDKALSGSGALSCASCHQPDLGYSDGLAVGVGVQRHVRNTQGLWNIGLQRWFGWGGGADSLWAATLRPMLSPVEMDGDIQAIAGQLRQNSALYKAFEEARGVSPFEAEDEALVVFAAKCIGAYMRTLLSEPTAFDRFRNALARKDVDAQGSYSASAKRGLKLFIGEANCQLCHYGPNFSNGEFHDIGRPFFTGVGQVDPGRHSGIERLLADRFNLAGIYNGTGDSTEIRKITTVKKSQINFGQWRTPTLRNLALTAPYMHDGSVATIAEVIDFYVNIDLQRLHSKGESILKPLEFTDRQISDLVAFLESLSPES